MSAAVGSDGVSAASEGEGSDGSGSAGGAGVKVTITTTWELGEWGDSGTDRERVWSLVGSNTRQVGAFFASAFGSGWVVRAYDPDGASLLNTTAPTEREAQLAADAALMVWVSKQGGEV